MSDKHEPNVIQVRNVPPSSSDAVIGFLLFVFFVVALVCMVYTIATRGEQPYKTYNVGGPVEVGTIEHDGHKFIVTNRFGVTLTHHPDCACQVRAEK